MKKVFLEDRNKMNFLFNNLFRLNMFLLIYEINNLYLTDFETLFFNGVIIENNI